MSDDTKIDNKVAVDNYDTIDALRASTTSWQDLEDDSANTTPNQDNTSSQESTVDLQDIAALDENEAISDLGNATQQEPKKLTPEEIKAKMANLAMLVEVEKEKNPPQENLASKPEDVPEEDLDDELDDELTQNNEQTATPKEAESPTTESAKAKDSSTYKNPNDNIINFANYKAAVKPEGFNVTNPADETAPAEVAANPDVTPADTAEPAAPAVPAVPLDSVEAEALRNIEKSEAKRAMLMETQRLRNEAKNANRAGAPAPAMQSNPELQGTPEEQEKQRQSLSGLGRNPHNGNVQLRTGIDGKAVGDATAHLLGNIIKSPITGAIAATSGVKRMLTDRAIIAESKAIATQKESLREHQNEKEADTARREKTIQRREEQAERISRQTALREAAKATATNEATADNNAHGDATKDINNQVTPPVDSQATNNQQQPVAHTQTQDTNNQQQPAADTQTQDINNQQQPTADSQAQAPVRKRRTQDEILRDNRNAVSSKNPLHNVNPAMKKSLETCSKSELGFAAAYNDLKENGDKMSPDERAKKEKELTRHHKNYTKNANLTNDMLDKVKGKNDPSNKAAVDMLDRMNDKMIKGTDEAHDKKFLDKDKLKIKNSKGDTISLEDIAKRTKALVEKIMNAIKKVVGAVASMGKKKP